MTWTLIMHHCVTIDDCHEHLIGSYVGVASGTFAAPDHDYPSYLELQLSATDADGLSKTTSVRLDPEDRRTSPSTRTPPAWRSRPAAGRGRRR